MHTLLVFSYFLRGKSVQRAADEAGIDTVLRIFATT
jgi:hypothetical protein